MVLREDLPAYSGCSDVEAYVVENIYGDGGSFPVGFDVAPDIGRIYVDPGDFVWVERVTPETGERQRLPVSPTCPDCHAVMTKETDEDVDGVMLVHWCCDCEWDGEGIESTLPVIVVGLLCSRCGTTAPRPDHCRVVECPECGHPMSLQMVRRDTNGWGIKAQPPSDVVTTGEDGEVTSA